MTVLRTAEVLRRFDAVELSVCRYLNRGCAVTGLRAFFATVSRLGDGVFWYALMLALPFLDPAAGWMHALQMLVTGATGVGLYKLLKHTLVRERPFIQCAHISLGAAPLDRYSFPSGHTLHAVSFTTLALSHYPELALLLVPFAILVAASRVVLGLHYPTDVLAGAGIGFALASASLQLFA
jgi:undecaprenyl-diphosphatase